MNFNWNILETSKNSLNLKNTTDIKIFSIINIVNFIFWINFLFMLNPLKHYQSVQYNYELIDKKFGDIR